MSHDNSNWADKGWEPTPEASDKRRPRPLSRRQGHILIGIGLLCLSALLTLASLSGGWINLKTQTQWEYRHLAIDAEATMDIPIGKEKLKDFLPQSVQGVPLKELQRLGREGWELVAAFSEVETVHPNFGKEDYVTGLQPNVRASRMICILKRPIGEP